MTAMHDLKERVDQFHFDYDPKIVLVLDRWEEINGEDIPIVREIAAYWPHEKEWKFRDGSLMQCNPYANVVLVRDSDKIPEGYTKVQRY